MPSALGTSRRNKRLAEIQAADARTEEEVIKALMSTPNGRRWVRNWMEVADIFNEGEHLDAQFLAYQKGKRHLGLRLLAQVTRHTPREYVTMVEEFTRVTLTVENADREDTETEPAEETTNG